MYRLMYQFFIAVTQTLIKDVVKSGKWNDWEKELK